MRPRAFLPPLGIEAEWSYATPVPSASGEINAAVLQYSEGRRQRGNIGSGPITEWICC